MIVKNIIFFVFLSPALCKNDISDDLGNNVVNVTELNSLITSKLGVSNETKVVVLKMLDAWSKIPSGILEGHLIDLGSFDECYDINYNNIYGKYCLGTLPFSTIFEYLKQFLNYSKPMPRLFSHPAGKLIGVGGENAGMHFAACVPSNMSVEEIPGPVKFNEDFCYSKATKPELSTGTIVTIIILVVFLCLVVVSTSYDIVLHFHKKKPHSELFIAFSFLHNGRKLFSSSKNSNQLLCLNGIKALSMMWIIIGHEYSNAGNAPWSNFLSLQDWQNNPAHMIIIETTMSVDTFLVVGGLVTVYTFLNSMDKGVKFNIVLFYVHRYLRLTPVYFIVGLIHVFLLDYIGNGPLWKIVDLKLVDNCRKRWWTSLLFISNYVQNEVCLPQAWYLSVDMQLFVLSPLVLIPLLKKPKIGLSFLTLLTIAGCLVPFVIGFVNNLGGTMINQQNDDYINLFYKQTYARFGPYVIGMLAGYYIYKVKKNEIKIRLRWWLVLVCWMVLVALLVACVYDGYPLTVAKEKEIWSNSLYLALNKPLWAVAVATVIFLCVSGYGGPIDTFLSLPIFQFLTKLSYSMYLVHYSVIVVRYAILRNNEKFSNLTLMHVFWGDFMFTLGLSLILCLTFESPIIILEKYLFQARGKPKRNTVKQ
ncbi:nose resistant to fluoxetine protein 6 isoform X2 [Tribolium castaneum]|uniref:nose resistant to fluoxetine protein 6 isoform X2 n=1 Tax=Tribolium castaneum TaxID=7070 RepID=UPI00077D98AE|nr:PREDICTED: nose resistant to fluoxetine protein 6 isoform X2 [Tribolium castaneum]|eukprot:XP_015839398.1 PREDICTED: nose resistant to fluoxetine protein 6 isoform X2 [Tribolium castaneum]